MCARSFFRLFRNACAAAHLCRGAAVPEGCRAPLFFAGTLFFRPYRRAVFHAVNKKIHIKISKELDSAKSQCYNVAVK